MRCVFAEDEDEGDRRRVAGDGRCVDASERR